LLTAFTSYAQELVIAQIASKTHPNSAELAKGLEVGYEAYFAQVNSQGGVRGNKLKFLNVDDRFNAAKMIELTKATAEQKNVVALAGFVGSGGLAQIAKTKLLEEIGIAMVAPLQGDQSVVSAPNFFPFRAGYDDEVVAMVQHAVKINERKRIGVIYLGASFGPILADRADKEANALGAQIVARSAYELAPDKIEASAKAAVVKVLAAKPNSVILVTAGKVGASLIADIRASADGAGVTIYAISALQSQDVVKQIGAATARGVIFAQSVPFPFVGANTFVREYQAAMKKHKPQEPLSFSSLEGYAGAKILVAAMRKAKGGVTRQSLVQALSELGEFDLGGVGVKYTSSQKRGWGKVDLTIVGDGGKLLK
jgi:branched-chain amino acid transport system substrate-binding protein